MTKPRGEDFWNDPEDERHGTTNGYSNLKCRCDRCKEAWKLWHREWMHQADRLERHAERQRVFRGKERTAPYQPRPRKNAEGEWTEPE